MTSGLISVRLQLNWVPEPEFGGLYAAREMGFFAEEGLAVELIKGSPGVPSAQLTASGKTEFGIVGGDQLVTMRARGAPLVAIYSSYQTFPRGIIVHDASLHTSLETLWKSKAKVAVEPGLPFVKWLNHRYGGADLTLVPSSGGLATFMQDPTLAQGVFVFAEPVELQRRKVPVRTFRVADSGYDPYTVVVATSEAYAKANPTVVAKLARAMGRGWAAYLADPLSTNRVMAQLNTAMSLESMNIAAHLGAPYVRGDGGALGRMTTARWATLVQQLHTVGAITKAPAAADCFIDVP
jgi:NitT/TauT family transport system substrate-binding protein